MATEIPIKIQIVKSLSTANPSRIVAVKADNESAFSLFVTDKTGIPYPLKALQNNVIITNTDGNLQITSSSTSTNINLASSILTTINSALQNGDNISELINDVGYLTTFTETDPIFQASEASLFVSGDKANLDNQSGVNSGNQTSIVGISGTKAQFNVELTDGDFLFAGDITQYTDELAQDAVGGILTDTTTIDLSYNDGLNTISADVKPNSIDATHLGNSINVSEFVNTTLLPYTGAISNTDLGEYQLKAGQLEFDQTPTGTTGVAILRWNDNEGTLDLGLKGGNVTLQLGQEQIIRIVNKTGVNLLESAYQVIYISGAQGNRLKVDLALANSDLTSAGTIGLVTETINNNQEGFITSNGLVRGINTTGSLQGETWIDGDILYVSPIVAGRLTNIKPIAPQHSITIGICVSAHITQGSIFVKVDNGYELEELHNVLINTPVNNQILTYESATSLWKNKTISDALGFTPVNPILNISTTFPLLGGGNLTADRTLSIQQSTSVQDGYLSSTDWNVFNNKQPAGAYITSLTGEVTASGAGVAVATLSTSAVTGKILTGLNITGGSISAADSILSAFGKVQNQINGVLGGSIFQTTWNASTNTPTLTSSVGTKGYYYIVDVAGSTNLDGITDWKVGDWTIYDGTVWRKVDNTDAVSSVNGFTGAVSLTTSNITEGTNLYYTEGRVSANIDVAANTAARHNAVTLGTTNGLSLSGQQISLGLSSTSTTGALSSTDWNTFNGKQAIGATHFVGTTSIANNRASGAQTLTGVSIDGNAFSATNWGGQTANFSTEAGIVDYATVFESGVAKYVGAVKFQSWLGLGSNAYTSTAYLPLTGGTLTGALNGTSFLSNQLGGGTLLNRTDGVNTSLLGSSFNIDGVSSKFDYSIYVYGVNPFNVYTNNIKRFDISGTGAATFASSVTAKGGMNLVSNNVNEDNVSYTITNTAASKIYSFTTGKQGITHNGVGIWNRTDNTHPIWFEDNGAATFSSSVTATNFNGSATLTGTPTAPTATAGTNTTQIATTAFVQGGLATKENSFSKNTAFNKNFGTTAGTVAEGNYSPAKDGTGASGTWGINISGNSGSATNWGGLGSNFSASVSTAPIYVVGYTGEGIAKPYNSDGVKLLLGLGSNAYTSTAYLPLNTKGGTPAAIYYNTTDSMSGVKIKLPFNTNQNQMVVFTIRMYQSYEVHDVQISGYLYDTPNQWYQPKAIMIAGSTPINIVMGRDTDGKAYVWTTGGSYAGVAVINVVSGFIDANWNSGWSITNDTSTPNQALNTTVYPNINGGNIGSQSVNYANSANSSNYLTGPAHTNGSDGWFRSDGNCGWYNQTYGGGIHMMDSTHVRVYGGKIFRVENNVEVSGNLFLTGNYGRTIVGVYDSARYQGIFAMGDSYKLSDDGTSTGSLYGLAWTHTNVGGQSKAGLSHQLLVMEAGVTKTAIGSGIWTSGNITSTGTITASGGFFDSDITLKNVIKKDGDVIYFKWKDESKGKETHIGYSAQSTRETHPDQVKEDESGKLSVNYIEILVEKIRLLEKRLEVLEGGNHGI